MFIYSRSRIAQQATTVRISKAFDRQFSFVNVLLNTMVTRDPGYRLSCLKTEQYDPSLLQTLAKVSVSNVCNLVPTVFLQHGKTKFKLPVSFSVYSRNGKTEFVLKRNSYSVFVFCFPTTLSFTTSIFLFPQLWTTDFKLSDFLFRLSFLYDIENRNLNFDFRLSFL